MYGDRGGRGRTDGYILRGGAVRPRGGIEETGAGAGTGRLNTIAIRAVLNTRAMYSRVRFLGQFLQL